MNLHKAVFICLFIMLASQLKSQTFYYNEASSSAPEDIFYYSIDSCKTINKTKYKLKDITTKFTYSAFNNSFVYANTIDYDKLYFCNLLSGAISTMSFPFSNTNYPSTFASKKDTIIALSFGNNQLTKINISNNSFINVGNVNIGSGFILEAICYYQNKLIGITSISNKIIEINTDNPANSKVLFTLPIEYAGYFFVDIFEAETCASSELYLLETANTEAIYKLDFVNQDLIKVCTSNIPSVLGGKNIPEPLSCLDLDHNNSTIKTEKDYKINLCQSGTVAICDQDIAIKTRPGYADSLHIWLDKGLQDIGNETITYLGKTPLGVTKKQNVNDIWFYFPKDFAEDSISSIIKNMRYTNNKPTPTLGIREVKMYLYTDKIVSDPAIAFINVSKNKQTQQNINVCNGKNLIINGLNIKKDTSFCEKTLSKEGCDSTHCITVKFGNQIEGNENKQICFGEKYNFKGVTYTKSGVYKDTLKSLQSCDSVVTYIFTVLSKKEKLQTITICNGTSYDFYGQNLTQSGNYEHIIKNTAACDSTVKLTLSVLPKKESTKQANICNGTSYDFYGQNLTQSGNYEHIIKNAAACDSTVKLTLSVLPKKESTKQASICNGTSYDFYGQNLTQSGDYEQVIKTAQGCDSLLKLKLEVVSKPILSLPKDITTNVGLSVTIEAIIKADSLQSISWKPSTFLDRNDQAKVISTPTENVEYQVFIKDKNNCTANGTIKVWLQSGKKIFTPSTFSPNDDGINDFFEIFVKADEGKVLTYEIYDRWGSKIYQSDIPWSGEKVAEGVYVFTATIQWNDGKERKISGEVLLLR